MKLKINILVLSSLLFSSAFAHATASSADTDAYIAALAHLLEQKTIGDAELVSILEAAEDGRVVNPISPVRAETSVEHFVANEALKDLLEAQIDADRVAAWAKENIKEQDRIRKKRKQTQEETQELWKDVPSVLSAGGSHSCAVANNCTVNCWGHKQDGRTSPPWGVFQSVSVGGAHACGLGVNGTVKCWGRNDEGQSKEPSGVFQSLSASMYQTCGLRANGAVECWGPFGMIVPTDLFKSVSANDYHACAVKIDGTIKCWGDNGYGKATAPGGVFRSVSARSHHTCGLKTDGSVRCWGENDDGQATAPGGVFRSVSAGARYNCGLKKDGTIACWGNNDQGQSTPPSGVFHAVSAGSHHACGLRVDGTVECWGNNLTGESSVPDGLVVLMGQINEVPPYILSIHSLLQRLRSWCGL